MTTNLSDNINTILTSTQKINQKIQAIAALNDLYKHHVGIEFLKTYTNLINNNEIESISQKDVARILSLSIPLNTVEFLELIKKNQQDLKPIIEAFHVFCLTFPLNHSQVTEYFALPLLFTSILYGDNNDAQMAFNINTAFFRSTKFYNEFPSIFKKIVKNSHESIYKLYLLFPSYFDLSLTCHLINSEFSDFEFLETLLVEHNLSSKNVYTVSQKQFTTSFYNYVAIYHLVNNTDYSRKLFNHFSKNYKYSLKENISYNNKDLIFIDFIRKFSIKSEAVNDIFKNIVVEMDEVDLMFILRHYIVFDFKSFINICSTPFFQQIINNSLIESSFFNKSELMQELFNLETSLEYDIYLEENHIFIRPAIVILKNLVDKFPDEFNKLSIYKDFFPNKNEKNKIIHLEKVSIDIQSLVKRSFLNHIDYITQKNVEDFHPIAIQSLEKIGFISIKNYLQKNGMFSKGVETQIHSWNIDFMQNTKNKMQPLKNNNVDFFYFLVGDSGESLSVDMIEIIKSENTKKIAKNIILMAYQFNELKMETLSNEEYFFMSNQLGKMINRILDTYKDYKNYDLESAEKTLNTQMLMLQKKTTEALDIVLYEDKHRLNINTKINNYFVSKPLKNDDM